MTGAKAGLRGLKSLTCPKAVNARTRVASRIFEFYQPDLTWRVVRTFSRSVVIDAPVEAVFAFHAREDALTLLSPRFPPVRVAKKEGGLETGASIELRVGPFRWVARHMAYENNRLFADEQVAGPFTRWLHRHEFEDLGGKTRLTDRVEWELPGGRVVNWLLGWAVTIGMKRLFVYRHAVTRRFCASMMRTP